MGQLNAQCDLAYELTPSVNNYYQCNSLSHRKYNKHITYGSEVSEEVTI